MKNMGGIFERFGLAMAGQRGSGRNPWGKSGDGGAGDGGDNDGPKPPSPSGGDEPPAEPKGPRNPWVPGSGSGGSDRERRGASIEDIFRNRSGPRGGGGPGGPGWRIPERPGGGSWLPIAMGAVVAIWVLATSVHFVQPAEQGVVTWLGGSYSRTLDRGTNMTLPWPIQSVDVEDVSGIRDMRIGSGDENLILTGDQNLVDLSYFVRWNIKDLVQYKFELVGPQETLQEVAESTMRAAIAETELDTVLSGEGRAQVQDRVRTRMQAILDAYDAGINVQSVQIDRTEAPQQVIEAFNDVLAARQDAERSLNDARRYEQQVLAAAQGDAAEFNEIYEQYRQAPEVTRRRLYYETMETVLRGTDKTIVEANGVTPYLPLPEVQRRSRDQSQPPSLTVTPSQGQRAQQVGQ